jgi:hypothetical protein
LRRGALETLIIPSSGVFISMTQVVLRQSHAQEQAEQRTGKDADEGDQSDGH